MWREYERKLHVKIIAIDKSWAEDDMIDSNTTGKTQKQHFFIYRKYFLFKISILNLR